MSVLVHIIQGMHYLFEAIFCYMIYNLGRNTNDGYNFRGSGYIHLTGRYNYQQFANAMNDQNIMQGADYVAENYAWEVAGWFWAKLKKINEKITPSTTVKQITKIVNGVTMNWTK